jgi:Na+-transporting NADH:ubiquinone oxidoreductase subunit C
MSGGGGGSPMAEGRGSAATVAVAAGVCLVCAVLVAAAAVGLRPRQEANAARFRQRTVLVAAGLLDPAAVADAARVARLYAERIESVTIDRTTGLPVVAGAGHAAPAPTPAPANDAGVQELPAELTVFRVRRDGAIDQYVLPIHGKGLWSTMRAFVALDADCRTIRGASFYEHGETPGLGAEIEAPRWLATWHRVRACGPDGEAVFTVTKHGRKDPTATDQVDGISGATLTCRGVEAMVRFWLGEAGYGPFLARVRPAAAAEVTDGR